jgi:hypothetical protein
MTQNILEQLVAVLNKRFEVSDAKEEELEKRIVLLEKTNSRLWKKLNSIESDELRRSEELDFS